MIRLLSQLGLYFDLENRALNSGSVALYALNQAIVLSLLIVGVLLIDDILLATDTVTNAKASKLSRLIKIVFIGFFMLVS